MKPIYIKSRVIIYSNVVIWIHMIKRIEIIINSSGHIKHLCLYRLVEKLLGDWEEIRWFQIIFKSSLKKIEEKNLLMKKLADTGLIKYSSIHTITIGKTGSVPCTIDMILWKWNTMFGLFLTKMYNNYFLILRKWQKRHKTFYWNKQLVF